MLGQLTEDEKRRWIANANATPDVSGDAIRAKEDVAAATLAGHDRHSISTEARDPWFAPRLQRLRTFLRDQPAGRASPTRAAAACGTPDGGAPTPPAPVIFPAPASPPPVPLTPLAREARVNALKAQWTARSGRNAPPPECHGPNDTHLAENTATFATRKAAQACFGCDVHGQLVPNQPQCRTGNASFTARGLRLSPGGTGSVVLAATEADTRALPAREGAGPGPVTPRAPPSHLGPGSGFGRRPA